MERMDGLPSWVPDFSTPIRGPCGEDTSSGPLFQASGEDIYSKTMVCSCQVENILGLSGTTIDKIEKLGSVQESHFNLTFNRTAAQRFLNEISDFCTVSKLYDTQAQVEDAKMRIPCADQECFFGTSLRRVSNFSSLSEDYESLQVPGTTVNEDLDGPGWKYNFSMAYQHNRKPFISTEGHVGLAPSTSQPGDLICIIFGATVPFILRPIANERFVLVGEAYDTVLWAENGWIRAGLLRIFIFVEQLAEL